MIELCVKHFIAIFKILHLNKISNRKNAVIVNFYLIDHDYQYKITESYKFFSFDVQIVVKSLTNGFIYLRMLVFTIYYKSMFLCIFTKHFDL